ncbi:6-phosphogluconolactonase [Motiliproteus sp. MSK22-1]|nr:6-phosphogluconolactonase [Motiliproteus sp. MSK22-1]
MPIVVRFGNRAMLEEHLCQQIVGLLRSSIDTKGEASLAVSGGRTPTALFQQLSEQSLDWSKVTIVLVDERWVDADHEDSNERLVRLNLLQNQAVKARLIGLKTAASGALEGMDELTEKLASLPPVLDAVILGMGEDGHTASFFPKAQELSQALDLQSTRSCQSVTPVDAPHQRMTLTLPRLLASQRIFLHLCGEGKLPVLEKAMKAGEVEDMPVRSVLRQKNTPVEICWAP